MNIAQTIGCVLAATTVLVLSACHVAPPAKNEYVIVEPNETVFVVPLQGKTAGNQAQMNSIEFFNANKVQSKRILIPHTIVEICDRVRTDCYVDQPTVRVIKISRAPVSRVWTSGEGTGTSASNQAFHFESSESIDFWLGASITAQIEEADTAKFLYYFAGQQLDKVIDVNVRSYISNLLFQEIGKHDIDYIRAHKSEFSQLAKDKATEYFKQRGITINDFGFADGMTYVDDSVQKAINKKFEADMQLSVVDSMTKAASKFAANRESIESLTRLENEKKIVDAKVLIANKYNGQQIPTVVSSDSMFGALWAGQPNQSRK